MTTAFTRDHLDSEAKLVLRLALARCCEVCGARRGQRCRLVRRSGTFHLVRLAAARAAYERDLARVPETDREAWRRARLQQLTEGR